MVFPLSVQRASSLVLVLAIGVGLAWAADDTPGRRSSADEPVGSARIVTTPRAKRGQAQPVPNAATPADAGGGVSAASSSERAGSVPAWLANQSKVGSSAESEQAVEAGLRWLAEHQVAAGGWSFDHRLGPCQARCSQPGALAAAVNGATGMALLPFISHGSTHLSGPYRQNVAAGLQFLIGRMKTDGSLWEPNAMMYAHALGVLALWEDCRIARETPGVKLPWPSENPGPLESVAQQQQFRECLVPLAAAKALAFTLRAQEPRLGGWRYLPGKESDISVTGWQVMGLHSAAEAGFEVPPRTSQGVICFLNSVQNNGGATYGYRSPEPKPTPTRTAIGLLGRIYTGCDREHPGLRAGVQMLANHGPDPCDMYFNYYATLVLHHCGGPLWEAWNVKMREMLIRSQMRVGHEAGSWSFRDHRNTAAGGRHFCTCMALLILETYYRSKPVYLSAED